MYEWPDGTIRVVYQAKYYVLQESSTMQAIVKRHLASGQTAVVGGKVLAAYLRTETIFTAYPFIDTTDQEDLRRYEEIMLPLEAANRE